MDNGGDNTGGDTSHPENEASEDGIAEPRSEPREDPSHGGGAGARGARDLAADQLLPMVYEELRRMAAARIRNEPPGQTLQATALVHEAWLRLRGTGAPEWENKAHFIGAAGHAMRRILVDNARRKLSTKRNTPEWAMESNEEDMADMGHDQNVLMIHESLEYLEQEDPAAAELVILKFFGGMDTMEIARMSGASVRSVERRWTLAKARLYQIIRSSGYEPGDTIP